MKTAYSVLGVSGKASDAAIKAALRKAAKTYHPDVASGGKDAEEHLKEAISAYELLRDPLQRAAYDRYLRAVHRARVRRFTTTAVVYAGLVGAAVLPVALWFSSTPKPNTAAEPRLAAAQVEKPQYPEAPGSGQSGPEEQSRRRVDWGGVAALDEGAKAPEPEQRRENNPQLDAPVNQPQGDSPQPEPRQAEALSLVAEWQQLRASGDTNAIWAFVVRTSRGSNAELAGSQLMQLMDTSDDVPLLLAVKIAAAGVLTAERAQQRLLQLRTPSITIGIAAVAKGDGAIEGAPLPADPAFYLSRGLQRLRSGDLDLAIAEFDEAIRRQPDHMLAHAHRANAWAAKADWDRALADFDMALRTTPESPAVLRDRAILWRRLGNLDRALVDFDQAIRLGFSDARAYNQRGLVWLERGRHERAIADFSQALKIEPTLVSALINRGSSLRMKGELELAIADLDQAIRLDPSVPSAYFNRALARLETQNFLLATADFAKAWNLLPSNAFDVLPAHLE